MRRFPFHIYGTSLSLRSHIKSMRVKARPENTLSGCEYPVRVVPDFVPIESVPLVPEVVFPLGIGCIMRKILLDFDLMVVTELENLPVLVGEVT